jgi:N-acetylglucosaminyldiphosphoundecaprenol N-acetyl-beta-D-mannosaminyltransferase
MPQASKTVRRIELLGAAVDVVTCEDVLAFISDAAETTSKVVIANQNLHSLCLSRHSPAMEAFYRRADLIEIDSMPMVLWGRLLGRGTRRTNRCTYLDWRDGFWALASERRWRVFLLGAEPGVAEEASRRLGSRWPGVEIQVRHGYFDATPGSSENDEVLEQINGFRPHVILVGMGMPRQEAWIVQNLDALSSGAILSVGGAFDYEAGVQDAAPRIYGRLCLEWMYRLVHDPRRLYWRYLVEPWALVGPAVRDLMVYGFGKGRAVDLRPAQAPSLPFRDTPVVVRAPSRSPWRLSSRALAAPRPPARSRPFPPVADRPTVSAPPPSANLL